MVPSNQWIKIKAPATVANMVCGFDILGFAVNNPYDEMEMRWMSRAENEASITIINIDNYNLPTDPEKNVAGAALLFDPNPIEGLACSKTLSPAKREHLAQCIEQSARASAVAHATVEEIDQLNILHASLLAM